MRTQPNNVTTLIGESGLPVVEKIAAALKGLRYGSVEIIVHDGRIVQIERRERWRVDADSTLNSQTQT
jgi:hypothetical protein